MSWPRAGIPISIITKDEKVLICYSLMKVSRPYGSSVGIRKVL